MIQTVVSVFDTAAGLFGRPIFVPSRGQAIRSFHDEINRADSEIAKHPEDYILYQLCSFDDNAGRFSDEGPQVLIRGKDAVVSRS